MRADTGARAGSCRSTAAEVADVRTEFQWFAGLPDGDDTQIGAWGVSLGGGAA
jgi:dienelactone hydrolase